MLVKFNLLRKNNPFLLTQWLPIVGNYWWILLTQ